MVKKTINKHTGSSFDNFLKEDGLLDKCKNAALKKVLKRKSKKDKRK